jgi:thioredoxin-related protein
MDICDYRSTIRQRRGDAEMLNDHLQHMRLSRRQVLIGAAAAAFIGRPGRSIGAELSEDGLYQQPWFLQSFLDLREDLKGAKAAGKTFVALWELKGCPFCKLLHTVNFANPTIARYAEANFAFLQLNIVGSRPVTDFDGRTYSEKQLAERHAIEGTPTLQFFHEDGAGNGEELGRTQYLKPESFYGMLRFVREKGYEDGPFDEWILTHPAQL